MNLVSVLREGYRRHTRDPEAIVPALPMRYQIEPTNFCNLKCPICYTHTIEGERSLSLERFLPIADQLPRGASISFFNWGEPFLNPEMVPIIREGAKRDFKIVIHSNMNFDPELIPQIAESGLHCLSASIDGITQETYEKFRRKGVFELAYGNLALLARIKAERGLKGPELRWQFIVNRFNEHEVDAAREMAAKLPSPVRFEPKTMGLRQEKVDWDQFSDEEMDRLKTRWLPENTYYVRRSHKELGGKALIEDRRCPWLWEEMVINVDGRVTPCCHTYREDHAFGDLNTSTLEEIWNNEAYVSSRTMFLDPKDDGCKTVCARCPNYLRIPRRGPLARNWAFVKWVGDRAVGRFRRALGSRLRDDELADHARP